MNDKDHNLELEAKIREYGDLPAHLLGLDGWMLRSIPESRRKEFLQGYEKLLKITFHPDRYQKLDEKQRKENYLQSVSNAIQYLTSDPMAFDIAVDQVGTSINPIVNLKRTLESREQLISTLEKQITTLQVSDRKKDELYQESQKELKTLYGENETLKNTVRSTSKLNALRVSTGYSLNHLVLTVRGRKVNFKERELGDLANWLLTRNLQEMTQESYKQEAKEFSSILTQSHLQGEELKYRFELGEHRVNKNEFIRLIGGLSLADILRYVLVHCAESPELNGSVPETMKISAVSHFLTRLNFTDTKEINGLIRQGPYGPEFYQRISPFRERQIEEGSLAILMDRLSISHPNRKKIKKGSTIKPMTQKDEFQLFYVEKIIVGNYVSRKKKKLLTQP